MSEECNKSCNTCSEECQDRESHPTSFLEQPHECSDIKKVIGVISGKGGVGKSLVTSMLAVSMNRMGYATAVLDADVTGPSIPKVFGIKEKAAITELGIMPLATKTGIQLISVNSILENDTDPVIWRGPIISGMVKQFWTDVMWGDIDFMFVDMPPGTGDVALTVFQSLPLDGIIIVTSPQDLVSMIVSKAVNMAQMMNIPILGIVENMSYLQCPDCHTKIKIFGESNIEKIAKEHKIDVIASMPLDPNVAALCDKGLVELFEGDYLKELVETIEKKEKEKMKIAIASDGKNVTEHFGHCESFIIFESENDKILGSEIVANPGHKPGFLPNYLNDLGVNVIISGGMGGGAIEIFNEKNIEVIVGASGTAQDAAQEYLKGNLKSTGSVCHEHQHSDECGH